MQFTATTTLVELHFDRPCRRCSLRKKVDSFFTFRLRIIRSAFSLENKTPGVLRSVCGDTQELLTSGGEQNVATIEIQTLSTGDFSFRARILQNPDPQIARRYLNRAAADRKNYSAKFKTSQSNWR